VGWLDTAEERDRHRIAAEHLLRFQEEADRTRVAASLILDLAGVDDSVLARARAPDRMVLRRAKRKNVVRAERTKT
jgi:hypothetical protein